MSESGLPAPFSPRFRRRKFAPTFVAVLSGLLLLTVLASIRCRIDLGELWHGLPRSLARFSTFFRPDLALVPELLAEAWITLLLAVIATPAALLLSIPIGVAAAANLSPAWIRQPVRWLLAFERVVPEIVIVFVLVAAYGLGIFPAVVALLLCSAGMLGKMLGDTIERVEPRTIEAVVMTGASPLQVMTHCVLPQVAPALVSYSLFRFEVNIRASAVLGTVAGQGIGYELTRSIGLMELPRASTAIVVLAVLILATERLCGWARRRILTGGALT